MASPGGLLGRLVVDLESRHIGAVPETQGNLFRNFTGILPVNRTVVAVKSPAAEGALPAPVVHIEHLRMGGDQPCGRAGRGRADNALDPRFSQALHHPHEPLEIIHSLPGFHSAPGKFPHAHRVDARFDQKRKVMLQFLHRFMLRIICNSVIHRIPPDSILFP